MIKIQQGFNVIQGLREDRDIRLFRLLLSLQHRDNRLWLAFIIFSLEKSLPQWVSGPTTCLLHLWEVSTCTWVVSKFKFQVPFWLYFQMKVTLLYTLAKRMFPCQYRWSCSWQLARQLQQDLATRSGTWVELFREKIWILFLQILLCTILFL